MAGGVIGKVNSHGTHLITNTFYGTCETVSETAEKIVKLRDSKINEVTLIEGMLLCVKFSNINAVSSPTLTVQNRSGSTTLIEAKNIKKYGNTNPGITAEESWVAGSVVPFIYDGTNWIEASSWDNNTTYDALSLGFGYGVCSTPSLSNAKQVTVSNFGVSGSSGTIITVNFTNGSDASAPTLNVNGTRQKPIYWHGAQLTDTHLIKPGDIVTLVYTGTEWEIISISPVSVSTTNLSLVNTQLSSSYVDDSSYVGILNLSNVLVNASLSTNSSSSAISVINDIKS